MIPDDAVEAAALALASKYDPRGEGGHGGEIWNRMVVDVRLALEAAAPHIMAGAWESGYTLGYADCANKQEPNRPNPHKEEA